MKYSVRLALLAFSFLALTQPTFAASSQQVDTLNQVRSAFCPVHKQLAHALSQDLREQINSNICFSPVEPNGSADEAHLYANLLTEFASEIDLYLDENWQKMSSESYESMIDGTKIALRWAVTARTSAFRL